MAETDESSSAVPFGRREWTFLSLLLPMNFVMGLAVSLQPPLYPQEV